MSVLRKRRDCRKNPRKGDGVNQLTGSQVQLSVREEAGDISANQGKGGSSLTGDLRMSEPTSTGLNRPEGRIRSIGRRLWEICGTPTGVVFALMTLFCLYFAFTQAWYKGKSSRLEGELEIAGHELVNTQADLAKATKNSAFYADTELVTEYVQFVNPRLSKKEAERIINAAYVESLKYDAVPPSLILFIIEIESSFKADAVSPKGAVGLMQIFPKVWIYDSNLKNSLTKIGITSSNQAMDVETNVKGGTYILNEYMQECIDLKPNELIAKGYESTFNCAALKYFGGHHEYYYDKLKKAAGNYWFFMTGNAERLHPIIMEITPDKVVQKPSDVERMNFGDDLPPTPSFDDDAVKLGEPLDK